MNLMRRFSVLPAARSFVFALALFAVAAPLLAAESYLKPNRPDGIALLAPPPAVGTPEHKADLAMAQAVFKARTPEELARAEKDASLSLYNFSFAIGSDFKEGKYPKLDAFFEHVKTNVSTVITIPKDHWKRLRPYQIDSSLELGKPEKSASYPSGHSTRGMMQALLLAEIFPDKQDAILQHGRDIGWDRVLIGKHFYTDVCAGRVLAQAIVKELHKSPAFEHDLAEVKAEVAAAQKK